MKGSRGQESWTAGGPAPVQQRTPPTAAACAETGNQRWTGNTTTFSMTGGGGEGGGGEVQAPRGHLPRSRDRRGPAAPANISRAAGVGRADQVRGGPLRKRCVSEGERSESLSDTLAQVLPLPPEGHPPPRTPRQQSPPLAQAERPCSQNSSRGAVTEFQEACQLPPVQTRRLK